MISFFLIPYHECWRDEAQAWLIARDTPLSDLFSVLRHEGHPALWFLLLMPFAKAGLPCICINYISWFITAISVFLIAIKAPFRPLLKGLLLLSPMYIFWLPVVSRSYALIGCLVTLLAVLYHKRKQHPIFYGILLFCLINLHLLIAGLVGSILLIDLYELYMDYKKDKQKISWYSYAGTLIGIIGCLLMVLQLLGSPDTGNWNVSVLLDSELLRDRLFFATSMFFPKPFSLAFYSFTLILFFIAIAVYLLLSKKYAALLIYFLEMLGVWYILLFIMPSGQKPYFLFLTIIFLLWITQDTAKETSDKDPLFIFKQILYIVFSLLLLLTIIKGYPHTIIYDIRNPYSMGKSVAEYLNENCDAGDAVIIMDNAYETSVTCYLDPSIGVWDITEGRFQSFPLWSPERSNINTLFYYFYDTIVADNAAQGIEGYSGTYMTDFMQDYINQCFVPGTEIYFVLNEDEAKLFDLEAGTAHYELLNRFSGNCYYTRENYAVYRFVSGN